MGPQRLQTQLLVATVLIICGLTGGVLLIVRSTIRSEIQEQTLNGLESSVRAFQSVQNQRQEQLSRTATLLAELPPLKALMTTRHAPTIQDASLSFWKLAGSDLFVLADPTGKVLGLHATTPEMDVSNVTHDLARSLEQDENSAWWYSSGHLYWVFIRPITSGAGINQNGLGMVAVGYQIDAKVAQQLAVVAESKIVLGTSTDVIASNLSPAEESAFRRIFEQGFVPPGFAAREITLANDEYEIASVSIHSGPPTIVQCYMLLPLQRTANFMSRLDRTILELGISAVLCSSILLVFISRQITRPLDNLVEGVRALSTGNFTYFINPHGSSEVVDLGKAFSKMRGDLLNSQQKLIETERIAALGRAASSISHDLRHYLAAVVANAEFLHEAEKLKLDKDVVYEEIMAASGQMTDLLDSLRDLARPDGSISPTPASLDHLVRRAADAILARPDMRGQTISIKKSGDMEGFLDSKKIERAFFNLILNASEATSRDSGKIIVDIRSTSDSFQVRVADNGTGIPEPIRTTLFDPFVSFGKSEGTGLGLAIVNKIVREHGGTVTVEHTSKEGSVFLVILPRAQSAGAHGREAIESDSRVLPQA
jgi:signal transduction histidine kinase